jgi:hypothetical protein
MSTHAKMVLSETDLTVMNANSKKDTCHYVLGHTNFWKKQEKNLQFF